MRSYWAWVGEALTPGALRLEAGVGRGGWRQEQKQETGSASSSQKSPHRGGGAGGNCSDPTDCSLPGSSVHLIL